MSAARQSRRATSSFTSSTASSMAKRQVSSSAAENIGKAAGKHFPKKRIPLVDVTNNRSRSASSACFTKTSRSTSGGATSVERSTTTIVKGKNEPSIRSDFKRSSSKSSLANRSNSATDSKLSLISIANGHDPPFCSTSDSPLDASPSKSEVSISIDESMSTCDSFKSHDFENVENDVSEANSAREKTHSNAISSDGCLYTQNSCADMEIDDEIAKCDANFEDPLISTSISCEIYKNLMESESKRRPSTDFMERVQREVTASMRAILIDWLVEVAEEYRLVPETLYLAVNYIDRYLSGNVMTKQKLQLLGVACMMIAAKYEEICAPQVEEFCYITDNTYFRDEVIEMESSVLNYLKFELTTPTAKCFLRRFVRVAAEDNPEVPLLQFECLANYITEQSLLEYEMLIYPPSLIAASAIFLANFILLPSKKPWNHTLQHYTRYRPSDLQDCAKNLHALCSASSASSLPSIREKYSQHKYKFVAKKCCPSFITQEYFDDQI